MTRLTDIPNDTHPEHIILSGTDERTSHAQLRKMRLVALGIVFGLFVISSFIQLPRGPYFTCAPGNRSGYRLQYGFPFVFIKRSVPTSACSWPETATATGDEIGSYGVHHVYPLALAGDVAAWSLLGLSAIKLLGYRKLSGRD